jgi:hypothetical protein
VALSNQNSGVVDRLGKTELEDLGLETAFQEILNFKTQNVIELGLGFVQDTNTDQTSDKGVTLEQTLGIFVGTGKQVTSSTTNFREGKTDSVDLPLVTETVLSGQLKLLVETFGLEGTLGDFVTIVVMLARLNKKV